MAVYQIYPKKKKGFVSGITLTTQLVILNVVLFFIFSILISSGIISIEHVALNPSNIVEGLYVWTFITSMFMHGNFFHLFVNMLSLFFVGGLVERILGKKRYFTFYLLSGLFAGVLFVVSSFIFPADFNTFAVGASGALFGLIGVLILLTPNLPVYLMFIPIPIKMKYAAPGMLVLLWLISIGADLPIGNVAHLGGLVAGLIYGFYLRRLFPNKVDYLSRRFS